MNIKRTLASFAILFVLGSVPAFAQSQASGLLAYDMQGTNVQLLQTNQPQVVLSFTISAAQQLQGCTTAPVIGLYFNQNLIYTLTLTNGALQWSLPASDFPYEVLTGIQPQVMAQINTAGVGCVDGAFPLTATISYSGPMLVVPSSMDFGTVPVGQRSPNQILTIANVSPSAWTLSDMTLGDGSHWDDNDMNPGTPPPGLGLDPQKGTHCIVTQPLQPGYWCQSSIDFRPADAQPYTTSIHVASSVGAPVDVTLTGTGVAYVPKITVTPSSVSFGNVQIGMTSPASVVTIQNSGSAPLSLTSIVLNDRTDFSLTATNCDQFADVLPPNQSCTVTLTFQPPSQQVYSTSLVITSNDPNTPTVTVPVSGIGVNDRTQFQAHNLFDAGGNLLQSGQLCIQGTTPQNAPLNFRAGSGGQVITRPLCTIVTRGSIPDRLLWVPDSSQTAPANVVYHVTVTDKTSGKPVLDYAGVYITGPIFLLDNYLPPPPQFPLLYGIVPPGGLLGQSLTKKTNNNYDYDWENSGSGVNTSNPYTWTAEQTFNGTLTYNNLVGVAYLVSHYSSLQAAINAAVGSGQVMGAVIDDRVTNYSGPGFNIPDSVTVQLAPVVYTITSTVTYNNGNNNVTAGIILQPGAHLVGAGTSTNHGTIVQPANGLNADLIATSTVGTGTATPQWWHWGEIGNLRLIGNGANQTAGECLKIENLGETARVHDIELSACYGNNLEFIGYSASQSAVNNVTSNRSVHGAGTAFTNLSGVGVLNGISGDCNQTALIAANYNAAGTLDIHGLKAEAEASICPAQVQDPVILISSIDSTILAALNISGGYAFGTSQVNFIKNVGPGSVQLTEANFYLNGYTNILNDTTRSTLVVNVAQTTKQPVNYLSNGVVFGNQAFTFLPNTFMQGNPNGVPTEMLGAGSDSSTDIAAIGNGDNSGFFTGGVKFGTFNRTMFGQTPEYQARMGWRWTNPGYDTNTWTFIPIWHSGDSSTRWLGDPNQRWPEIYAADVDATTAHIGSCIGAGCGVPPTRQVNGHPLSDDVTVTPADVGNSTAQWNANQINGHAPATVATSGSYNDLANQPSFPHVLSGSMQGPTAATSGTGAAATLYSYSIPSGTFSVGMGVKCFGRLRHTTGSAAVTMYWKLGATTYSYPTTFTTGNNGGDVSIEIFTPASLTAEVVNLPWAAFGGTTESPYTGLAWSENLNNAVTIYLQFNVAATDKVTGDMFWCSTIQ